MLLVRVTPKLVEGFWTMVARGAARTQGVAIPPIKRVTSGFSRLQAFCGETEVTPIHPFKLEQRLPDDNVIYEGLYVFAPDALGPTCGTVKLTVAVTVIPSATQFSSTSSPAPVAGSFTAIFGDQAWNRLAIAYMQSRSPARSGFTCAQTSPEAPWLRSNSGISF